MKTLTLFRHGKSSWEYDVSDKERPLKKRGFTDVNLISNHLKSDRYMPDCIMSSPAKRALDTCYIFSRACNIPDNEVITNEMLYDFGGSNVIDVIKSIDNNYSNILLFGHNHAFTNIVNTYGDLYINNLPTSGVVSLKLDIEYWKNFTKGKTIRTLFPRDLR